MVPQIRRSGQDAPDRPEAAAEEPHRDLVVLGSTGSIGTQALDVVRRNRDRFRVVALAAGGERVETLAGQALEFGVEAVAIAKASAAQDLQLAFYAAAKEQDRRAHV